MAHVDVDALHKQLIRFPSLSGDEGPIADYIERFVSERGVQVGRHDNNVYFWVGDGDDTLLLNTHLDVVPPSSGHPHDPFDPVERDGRIYGRGSVDAKASVASMTGALLSLEGDGWLPPDGRVMVALTTHEETGGVYNGLENLRPHLPALSGAIVGEPTDLEPCVAQKGLLILNVHARGKTAHAARPHLGDNAVLKAARDIGRLESFPFEREDPFLGSPTITVTTIEGGSARNVVPDRCTFTLDIRTTPGYSHDELFEQISSALESDVEIHSKRIVPVSTPLESRIVRACVKANPEAQPFGSPTASDWIFLHDVPTVKIGPGSSDLSHTADESIPRDELLRGVELYTNIIKAFFMEQDTR